METSHHPIDLAELRKGENYDMEARGVLTTSADHPHRKLELLCLRDEIQRMCEDAGLCMSLICKGDRIIRVMTDSEAADYHDKQSALAIAKLGRQVKRLRGNVDRGNLDEIQQQQHAQSLARRSLQYMAVRLPAKKQAKMIGKRAQKLIDQTSNQPNPFSSQT